ncbi:MAG: hypothetical protein ACYDCO_03025 [Armatimonadota bacterium]
MVRIGGWLILLLSLVICFSPQSAIAAMTKEQAVTAAQEFARKMGWQLGEELISKISANGDNWEITF